MNKKFKVGIKQHNHSSFIEMIKAYRSSFRVMDWEGKWSYTMGLKDAKEACEQMRDGHNVELHLSEMNVTDLQSNGFIVESENFVLKRVPKVMVYIKPHDRKIEAIKKFRGCTGLGLKEAKEAIDYIFKNDRPVEVTMVNNHVVTALRSHGFTVTGFIDECFVGQEDLFEI